MTYSSSTLVAILSAISLLSIFIYYAFLHPLRDIPGPLVCRVTSLWTYYHSYIGDECTEIVKLHKIYGPVVRIAPNEVIIADGTALAPIYVERGGFLKAPCYTNFDIEGHPTIFSTQDPAYRAVRSKAVVPIFSMSNIRAGSECIEACVTRMVERLASEAVQSKELAAKTGQPRPVDVLNLARSLALDAVSSYLFGQAFGGINETSSKLSASSFVDAFVAVGRFFYLPNWLFLTLELAQERLWPDKEQDESARKVNSFVGSLVDPLGDGVTKQNSTYQSRLLKADITEKETEIQCKDLIFAGTDSTGTNVSFLIWNLAKWPRIYDKLREEIAAADAQGHTYNPQSLPYLDAVIRETLRISMANPSRFPRVVPAAGWNFKSSAGRDFRFPAGTIVGCQPYSLHFNEHVFPEPFAFKPERWLDNPTLEMQRDAIPFGTGSRQCIARNLATTELFLVARALARSNILQGAEPVGEKIEIVEWFNSRIKGDRIEVVWK